MPDTRIQLHSGVVFDPLHPDFRLINIEDIAHALSNQCRFSGHVTEFYSVAQHSLHVSEAVEAAVPGQQLPALWGLLHDATEAYLQDVPSPLKHALFGDKYRHAEGRLMKAIASRFELGPEPDVVRRADLHMLVTEVRDLMPHAKKTREGRELWAQWLTGVRPFSWKIVPLCPEDAADLFMYRYLSLTGANVYG